MILKIGEEPEHQIWHLHVHHEFLGDENLPRKKRRSWDVISRVCVHTGPCIWTVPHDGVKYCVNGEAGESRCSKKDAFVRSVGLKLALRQALSKLPEPTRKAIWEALWKRMRRPHEKPEKFQKRLQASKAA